MARLQALTLAFVALGALLPPAPAVASEPGTVAPWTDPVDGAAGILGIPSGTPRALIVFDHGLSHIAADWQGHVQTAADQGYVAVAMNYSAQFNEIAAGAARTNTAARHLQDFYGVDTVILFGVSMGGAVSGLALAEAPARVGGGNLYDYWFNIEGVTNQFETWAEAAAIGHPARGQIESENGGTPADHPDAYVRRSSALRATEIAGHVKGIVMVHAVNDGLVPHNQGVEGRAAFRAAAIPVDFYTVARGSPMEPGTTGTAALGLPNPANLAGHATETSTTHPVMRTALARLYDLLQGGPAPLAREFIVDEQLGQIPS